MTPLDSTTRRQPKVESLLMMARSTALADRALRMVVTRRGYRLEPRGVPKDMGESFNRHYDACSPFSMTSAERLFALDSAVRFVIGSGVPGDFVECGVWRGGSALLIARALGELDVDDRRIWLYDTFAGMSEPSVKDGISTRLKWTKSQRTTHNNWCYSPLNEVKDVMARSSYPSSLVTFVEGKVEDTIPREVPELVALLRLDTDWYESTLHELTHLWPRLAPGGILIIDDYGHWEGARRAVDEFFSNAPVLLHRTDYTGRVLQKPL